MREIRKYGAEVIKICATGGVFSHNTELPAAAYARRDEGHRARGQHVGSPRGGSRARRHGHSRCGARGRHHSGARQPHRREGIAAAKKMGTFLSMDIYNTDYTQSEGPKNGVMEDNLRKDREVAEVQRQASSARSQQA